MSTRISVVKTVYPPLSSSQATQPSSASLNQRPMSTHLVVLDRRPKTPPVLGPSPKASQPTTAPATQPIQSVWMFTIPSEPNSPVDDSKIDTLLGKFNPLRADKYLEKVPDSPTDQRFIVTLETKSLNKYHIEVTKPANGQTVYATYNGLIFELPTAFLGCPRHRLSQNAMKPRHLGQKSILTERQIARPRTILDTFPNPRPHARL